jgi:hypothetical protein
MHTKTFDPDASLHDNAPYWAAVLVIAIRCHDTARADTAKGHLRRLGCPLDLVRRRPRKEARRAAS